MAAWNRRFCIARVIGDGLTPETAFRAKVVDYPGVRANCLIRPGKAWALAICSVANDAAIQGDPDIKAFPAGALDNSLTAAQRNNISNAIQQAFGFTPTASTTLRGYVRQVVKNLDADASEDDL